MKRDWDLIRALLLRLEERTSSQPLLDPDQVPPWDSEMVSYHLHLLGEAGLADIVESKRLREPMYAMGRSLTWSGHEFLDAIRSASVWEKVKTNAKEKGLDLTFDLVKGIAAAIIKGMFGL